MRGKMREMETGFEPINPHIYKFRIKRKFFNHIFTSCIMPTEASDHYEKDRFYEILEKDLINFPKDDIWLLLGDSINNQSQNRKDIGPA